MNKNIIAIASAIAISISANSAIAAPIADNSLTHLFQYGALSGTTNYFSSNSTDSYYSHTLASDADVQGYGDLTTGKVGTRVINSGSGRGAQSWATIYDTLTFDTGSASPVEVSFSLFYEGTLASSSIYGNPRAISFVHIFDITGLGSWLETYDFLGLAELTRTVSGATLVTTESDQIKDPSLALDGLSYGYDFTLNGSFMADPSKTYGIAIGSDSFAGNNAASDFLGTGTFSFTNLNGANFTSGSGDFLSSQTTTVPEPSALWLISLGMIGLIGMSKKSTKASQLPA